MDSRTRIRSGNLTSNAVFGLPSTAAWRVLLGAWLWLAAVQFYITQPIVAAAWTTPYSLAENYISDLGNTGCAQAAAGIVTICSPWHGLMNVSFVLVGVTMAAGALFAWPAFQPGGTRSAATAAFVIGGIGGTLVGLHPENEMTGYHYAGAAVNFIAGNIALVLYGLATSRSERTFRIVSIVAGSVGLVSTFLLANGHSAGLGVGGIERVAGYPISLWQIGAGAYLLRRGTVTRLDP